MKLFLLLFSPLILVLGDLYAQSRLTLGEISEKMNKNLPEVYDHITTLKTTSLRHNHFVYSFTIDLDQEAFEKALPQVKKQVFKNACLNKIQKMLLTLYKTDIVYIYENLKGISLGQFMIKSSHCD